MSVKKDKMRIRVKAKEQLKNRYEPEGNGLVDVKLIVKHPMETGRRKDKEGKLIPAKHLTVVSIHYNEKEVFSTHMGTGVSKDPYIAIQFSGTKGGKLKVVAEDNTGEKVTKNAKVSIVKPKKKEEEKDKE